MCCVKYFNRMCRKNSHNSERESVCACIRNIFENEKNKSNPNFIQNERDKQMHMKRLKDETKESKKETHQNKSSSKNNN